MTGQINELRSWILITVSFALGMMIADFIDYRWQASQDSAISVAVSESVDAEGSR